MFASIYLSLVLPIFSLSFEQNAQARRRLQLQHRPPSLPPSLPPSFATEGRLEDEEEDEEGREEDLPSACRTAIDTAREMLRNGTLQMPSNPPSLPPSLPPSFPPSSMAFGAMMPRRQLGEEKQGGREGGGEDEVLLCLTQGAEQAAVCASPHSLQDGRLVGGREGGGEGGREGVVLVSISNAFFAGFSYSHLPSLPPSLPPSLL